MRSGPADRAAWRCGCDTWANVQTGQRPFLIADWRGRIIKANGSCFRPKENPSQDEHDEERPEPQILHHAMAPLP